MVELSTGRQLAKCKVSWSKPFSRIYFLHHHPIIIISYLIKSFLFTCYNVSPKKQVCPCARNQTVLYYLSYETSKSFPVSFCCSVQRTTLFTYIRNYTVYSGSHCCSTIQLISHSISHIVSTMHQ